MTSNCDENLKQDKKRGSLAEQCGFVEVSRDSRFEEELLMLTRLVKGYRGLSEKFMESVDCHADHAQKKEHSYPLQEWLTNKYHKSKACNSL